jgi:hypothetical protein
MNQNHSLLEVICQVRIAVAKMFNPHGCVGNNHPLSATTWRCVQKGFAAAEARQPPRALAFNQSFQGLANQGGFLRQPGKILRNGQEIIIECQGCPHGSHPSRHENITE